MNPTLSPKPLAPSQRSLGAQEVTLSNCDREPIHTPGHIQPFAAIVAIEPLSERIVGFSANTEEFLGRPPSEVAGQTFDTLLAPDVAELVREWSRGTVLERNPLYAGRTPGASGTEAPLEVVAHRHNGVLLLEFEHASEEPDVGGAMFHSRLRGAAAHMEGAASVSEFCGVAASEVRALTGFDRVMIYRFAPDGHGEVIAESKIPELEPFLGLHYPASDIPRQARALALLSWVRYLPDARYEGVPLQFVSGEERALDLSYCASRGVSPIHLEYLANMGVGATLTVSIVHNGRLWGLIACHHQSPRAFSYARRAACEFLGQTVSLQLARREERELAEHRLRLQNVYSQFVEGMMRDKIDLALTGPHLSLLDFVEAGGAAISVGGKLILQGITPPENEVRTLGFLLRERARLRAENSRLETGSRFDELEAEGVFVSHSLERDLPESRVESRTGAGVLGVAILGDWSEWLLWFRPEEIQTVTWAGNPRDAVKTTADHPNQATDDRASKQPTAESSDNPQAHPPRLHPRASFAAWSEEVRGAARAWDEIEIAGARDLRRAIGGVVAAHTDELARLNAELRRSNHELEAFAYVASHDLKEPLRGIANFSHFLLEDYGDQLDAEGVAKLETLGRLTRRMSALLDSLLHYSRAGRAHLERQSVDLNVLVEELHELIADRLKSANARLEVPRALPVVQADRERVGEILQNLVTNALKYNDKAEKRIEIGWEGEPEHPIIRVSDNGLGIDERHFATIFQIFRRLHGRESWGGGTGAGLTIVKLLVERHDGRIWLESRPGEGSTFYFSLSPQPQPQNHERLFVLDAN